MKYWFFHSTEDLHLPTAVPKGAEKGGNQDISMSSVLPQSFPYMILLTFLF